MCLSEPCYSIAQIYFTLVQNRVLSLGSVWRIIYMATDHCLDTFSRQFCVRFQQLSRQQFCSLTSTTTPLSTRYTQSVSFCRLNLFPRRFGKVLTFSVCQKYELDCNSYITYFIFAFHTVLGSNSKHWFTTSLREMLTVCLGICRLL